MKRAIVLAVALAVPGCIVVHDHDLHPRHVVHDDDYEVRRPAPVGQVVVIERGHIHSEGCGHYWYNGSWYHSTGHVHGAGCGHAFVEGVWVHAGVVTVAAAHVHNDHCGHFQCGGSWYYMHEHHHGPGCGHSYRNGVWIAVKW